MGVCGSSTGPDNPTSHGYLFALKGPCSPEYHSLGQDQQKNKKPKNKYQIFGKNKNFKINKLHGEKENFTKYSLNLASVKLNFHILINYSVGKCQIYPRTTVPHIVCLSSYPLPIII